MNQFRETVFRLLRQESQITQQEKIVDQTYFLQDGAILEYPRETGESRYPYQAGGLVVWVSTAGKISVANGRWTVLPEQLEAMEPAIAFFQKADDGKTIPLLRGGRTDAEGKRFTVFTQEAAFFFVVQQRMVTALQVQVRDSQTLLFRLGCWNCGEAEREVCFSSYLNPLLRHEPQDQPYFKWWKRCTTPQEGRFLFETQEDVARGDLRSYQGVWTYAGSMGTEATKLWGKRTTARSDYFGSRHRGLEEYQIGIEGSFQKQQRVCAFIETAIAGEAGCYQIPAGKWLELEYQFQWERPVEQVELPVRQGALEVDWSGWDAPDITDGKWNRFWRQVCRQSAFCAFGKNYAGPMLGVRDVFQHIEAALYWEPQRARQKIIQALDMIFIDGRPPRQYGPTEQGMLPEMDIRFFIDQGAWILSTVTTYLRATGDRSILQEQAGYYELLSEEAKTIRRSGERDSVMEHLLRIADFLLRHLDGETGCLRAMYGDWNDALDGLGVSGEEGKDYGSGVSVMASLQLYQNLGELEEIAEWSQYPAAQKNRKERIKAREKLRQELQKWALEQNGKGQYKVLHGWGDKRNYLVGSWQDVDGNSRDALTVNAFWVLSGMLEQTPERKEDILQAFRRLDSAYGFRTFAPGFAPQVRGVGRIVQMPEGTAENGGVYIHASMFAVRALFQMGEAQQAWQQLYKLLPITHRAVSHSPFVMPNSYCENPALGIQGESMNDWYTGSANGLVKTILHFGLGIYPQFGGVWLQPPSEAPYREWETTLNLQQGTLSVRYMKKGGSRRFWVNGEERGGSRDAWLKTQKCWIATKELQGRKVEVEIWD